MFPVDIARPLSGVKLLGGAVSHDLNFCKDMAMRRVMKTTELMCAIRKLRDPQCEMLLLRACSGVSKLYYAFRTSAPIVFSDASKVFDTALRESVESIVTDGRAGFGAWQWRQATMPIKHGGLGLYTAADTLKFAYTASRLQSMPLQNQILNNSGIFEFGFALDSALQAFKAVIGSNVFDYDVVTPAPQLMKAMAGLCYNKIDKDIASVYSLSTRELALWSNLKLPHVQDWLLVIPVNGLNQTMEPRAYRSVLQYRMGIEIFRGVDKCPSCDRVILDKWGDHALMCASDYGIKHRHNHVRDTLYDLCFIAGISSKKEAGIGLVDGKGGELRPADVLLYNWEDGRSTCIDVTVTAPFCSIGTDNFVAGEACTVASQKKKKKYVTACEGLGYNFVSFAVSTIGDMDSEATQLLTRIHRFLASCEGGSRLAMHVFSRIAFAVQRGCGAQLACMLPSFSV
ncbi:hypothetical protein ACHQM5_010751 [Ranunculus cassubicifolius]